MTAVARSRARSRAPVRSRQIHSRVGHPRVGAAVTAHSPPAALRDPSRGADQSARRRLRVVDAAQVQATRRVRRIVAVVSMLVATALVLAVVFHVALAQGQLELDRLREDAAAEQERYERLRVEVAAAAAPEEIMRRAETLGMTEPAEIVHISPLPGTSEVFSSTPEILPTATGNWPTVKPHLAEQP